MDNAALLDDDETGASQPSGTRTVGATQLVCCVVFPQLVIGAVLVWYSTQLPATCTSGLQSVLHSLAFDYVAVASSVGCAGLCASHLMFPKQESERRGASRSRKSEGGQTGKVMMCFAMPCFCVGVIGIPVGLTLWVRGIVVASETPAHSCENGPAVLYSMLGLSIGLMVCGCGLQRCCGRTATAVLDDDGLEEEDGNEEEYERTP